MAGRLVAIPSVDSAQRLHRQRCTLAAESQPTTKVLLSCCSGGNKPDPLWVGCWQLHACFLRSTLHECIPVRDAAVLPLLLKISEANCLVFLFVRHKPQHVRSLGVRVRSLVFTRERGILIKSSNSDTRIGMRREREEVRLSVPLKSQKPDKRATM